MSLTPAGTLEITTDRLLLRRFTVNDAPNIYNNWASNPNVTKYLDWKAHSDINETKAVLNEWLASYESGYYFNWAVTLLESIEPIGAIGLNFIDIENESGEIGFLLCEDYWNKGITTEALGFSLNYLFNTVQFNIISAHVNELNTYSRKLLKGYGFKLLSGEYVLKRNGFIC